jgi:hypothetical protein
MEISKTNNESKEESKQKAGPRASLKTRNKKTQT